MQPTKEYKWNTNMANLYLYHLQRLSDEEISKGYAFLLRIFKNILSSPNNEKYHSLNIKQITKRLKNPIFMSLLIDAGFNKTENGKRLLFDTKRLRDLIRKNSGILSTVAMTKHNKQMELTINELVNDGFSEEDAVLAISESHIDIETKPNNDALQLLHVPLLVNNDININSDHNDKYKDKKERKNVNNRMMQLLEIYRKWRRDKNKKQKQNDTFFSLICGYYKTETIDLFLDDYDAIIKYMDVDKVYIENNGKCELKDCYHLKRNYRNTDDLSKDNRKRIILYDEVCDEKEIIYIQHLDIIHNTLYHLIDCGLRFYDYDDEKLQNESKTNEFDQITRSKYCKGNKFVTFIAEQQEEKDSKYPVYSPGVRFNYWVERGNDAAVISPVPPSYDADNIFDWFISANCAIHKDLKTEILSNPCHTLSKQQWDNNTTKAKIRWCRHKKHIYLEHVAISVKHIISLLLYTDFDALQNYFSKTFRKLSNEETDNELKDRHSHFYHWGKLLTETVTVFGVRLCGKYPEFYHGINQKILFLQLSAYFRAPTSMTTQEAVAFNFATTGIMITIQNDKSASCYFDCAPFSRFPSEKEMLFIAGERLQIIGLCDLAKSKRYTDEVIAIKIIDRCLMGAPTVCNVSQLLVKKIHQLLENKQSIPPYIMDIFHHLLKSRTTIIIDIGLFTKELVVRHAVFGKQYGYMKLASFFMDSSSKWINLRVLNAMCPHVEYIQIQCVEWSQNTVNDKAASSILITDFILSDIYQILESTSTFKKLIGIFIMCPKNVAASIYTLCYKHQQMFSSIGYYLNFSKVDDAHYGVCDAFGIKKPQINFNII